MGIDIEWQGSEQNEQAIDKKTGKILVKIHPRYYRPTEVDILLGKATKAEQILKWKPKTHFKELVKLMVEADIKLAKQEMLAPQRLY